MSVAISLSGVSHTYSTGNGALPVLKDVSLTIPADTFTAVVGPSGCGKSTLTRLVSGLMMPTSGDVFLGEERVTAPTPKVGMAFQNPVLLEWRSIIENVVLPLEIVKNDLTRQQQLARAESLLAMVGLQGFESKKPSELSGGMRQRASLCRALVHKPDILILDEPFGALDAFTREDLWQTMRDLKQKESFTALLITHDLRESVFLGDEVIVMSSRPAGVQYQLPVSLPKDRRIDTLYEPEAVKLLATLRQQIEIAQGRKKVEAA